MNAVLMTQYLEFVADRLLVELGCDREYNTTIHLIYGYDLFKGKQISSKESS
jgi:ribonucleotide reductase beta subunit family protein with ferritin-like domain